jgi:hypothetical protein
MEVRKRRLFWLHPLILVALLKISVSCIADDEFLCEEAATHLFECCPELNRTKVDCSSEWRACSGFQCDPHFTATTLTVQESNCILDKSCDALRTGTCPALNQAQSKETVVCR